MLFRGLPFVALQRTLANESSEDRIVRSMPPVTLTLDLGQPAESLRALAEEVIEPSGKVSVMPLAPYLEERRKREGGLVITGSTYLAGEARSLLVPM